MTRATDSRYSAGRRRLLRAGALGYLGLTLADLLRAEEGRRGPGRPGGNRSCILLYYYGGPSHLDT